MEQPTTATPLARSWPWVAAALACVATAAFPFFAGSMNRTMLSAFPQNLAQRARPTLEAAIRSVGAAPDDPSVLAEAARIAHGAGDDDLARDFSGRATLASIDANEARWPELFADEIRTRVADNAFLCGSLDLRSKRIDDGIAWILLAAATEPVLADRMLGALDATVLQQCSYASRTSVARMRGLGMARQDACVPFAGEDRYAMRAAMERAGYRYAGPVEADGVSDGIIAADGGATIYTDSKPFELRFGPASASLGHDRVLMLCGGVANKVGPLVRVESSLGWSQLLYLPDVNWFPVELPARGAEASETISVQLLNPGSSAAWRLPSESAAPWYADNRHVSVAGIWICGAGAAKP